MGNRAVISSKNSNIGVYLHWNGGRDSIEAFLKYCELRGFRPPSQDSYGWARLTQVIANFFGKEGLCVGIEELKHLDCDNGDNGQYEIDGWDIVGRKYYDVYKEQAEYELKEMLFVIDNEQPESQRIFNKDIDLVEAYLIK